METTLDKNLEIDRFESECPCISKLLSIKDKLIYFVVSAFVGEFVVPLIHKHRCIENIYVYQNSNDADVTWINEYSKISMNESSINLLATQIEQDINSIMQRPSSWSRSKTLLNEFNLQTSEVDLLRSIEDTPKDNVNTLRIVTLFFGTRRLFSQSQSQIQIDEFNDFDECLRSIRNQISITVFLIISINGFDDMHSLFDLDNIHAVYIILLMTIMNESKLYQCIRK